MLLRKFYAPVKALAYVVLALMLAAACYAFVMIILHWTDINV